MKTDVNDNKYSDKSVTAPAHVPATTHAPAPGHAHSQAHASVHALAPQINIKSTV